MALVPNVIKFNSISDAQDDLSSVLQPFLNDVSFLRGESPLACAHHSHDVIITWFIQYAELSNI